METLIDSIEEEMFSDTGDREKESEGLIRFYNKLSPKRKEAVDFAFMYICGWSLKTLMEMHG